MIYVETDDGGIYGVVEAVIPSRSGNVNVLFSESVTRRPRTLKIRDGVARMHGDRAYVEIVPPEDEADMLVAEYLDPAECGMQVVRV